MPYASKNNEWVGFDNRESYEIKVGGTKIHRDYRLRIGLRGGGGSIKASCFVVDSSCCSMHRSST